MSASLKTPADKLLHNNFLRAILCNAHFSIVPPPGISIPRVPSTPVPFKPPSRHSRLQNSDFQTFAASDLGHLLTFEQLHNRCRILLFDLRTGIKTDPDAVRILSRTLKLFVLRLLMQALKLTPTTEEPVLTRRITVDGVTFVIASVGVFSEIVSQEVFLKFRAVNDLSEAC
jgi:hypothetical protein